MINIFFLFLFFSKKKLFFFFKEVRSSWKKDEIWKKNQIFDRKPFGRKFLSKWIDDISSSIEIPFCLTHCWGCHVTELYKRFRFCFIQIYLHFECQANDNPFFSFFFEIIESVMTVEALRLTSLQIKTNRLVITLLWIVLQIMATNLPFPHAF